MSKSHDEKSFMRLKNLSGRPSPVRTCRIRQVHPEEKLEAQNDKRSRLAEKDNLWLDEGVSSSLARLFLTSGDFATHDLRFDVVLVVLLAAAQAFRGRERAMRFDQPILFDPGEPFERIDVLRPKPVQDALVLQESEKVVRRCRLEVARVQFFRQRVKRFRMFFEVVDIEYGFGVRQVVLRQVVVQSCPGRAEIWNASGGRDASSSLFLFKV